MHKKVLKILSNQRNAVLLGTDTLIIALSLHVAFLLRFDFHIPDSYYELFYKILPIVILVKVSAFYLMGAYRLIWRYVGVKDLWNIIKAVGIAQVVIVSIIYFNPDFRSFPRSVVIVDGLLTFVSISSLRLSKRFYLEILKKRFEPKALGKKTLIIGAGNTGEMLLREMGRMEVPEYYPVGFLDDDPSKMGNQINQLRVLGGIDQLEEIARKKQVEAIIIAIPSINHNKLRQIYKTAQKINIRTIKLANGVHSIAQPHIAVRNIEDVKIEDLLGRQEIRINYSEIESFLRDKVILITGAGGSIGSEITKQVSYFNPERVILFDIDETALHNMSLKLRRLHPEWEDKFYYVVGDIKDRERVYEVFKKHKPNIVFHAAAYKHVPMMEYNPKEAVKVNIIGSYNLAKAAIDSGVKEFIAISTDKAVNPTSVMGATKRIVEYICTAFNEYKTTSFISVRFGNVLGSRGSLLPILREQLEQGGPLTVTHPEMKRYFMTIPEAVSLVLQAATIGKPGEVLVLDMGEPVKIIELVEEFIRLHGLEPYKDIKIDIIGLRPGEKLFEELLTAEEGTIATKHERIFIAKISEKHSPEEIENLVREFASASTEEQIIALLKKYVKSYTR